MQFFGQQIQASAYDEPTTLGYNPLTEAELGGEVDEVSAWLGYGLEASGAALGSLGVGVVITIFGSAEPAY